MARLAAAGSQDGMGAPGQGNSLVGTYIGIGRASTAGMSSFSATCCPAMIWPLCTTRSAPAPAPCDATSQQSASNSVNIAGIVRTCCSRARKPPSITSPAAAGSSISRIGPSSTPANGTPWPAANPRTVAAR
ncbi:hypothetical protein [Arthrobacter oryzae]|uniref:hypothetical protein n=1 Tax=Arthrobacter oryzae TaxID=409290 RepID=UPI00273C1545|nr:hypothetical protein [Arthrobacter oryzae]WLQ07088.1 hypothetical protein Q8Z05_02740 [Arthrobacter oryzae]